MQAGSLPLSILIAVYVLGLLIAWLLARRLRSIRQRQLLLLAISYILYATWGFWFLAALVSSSLMNYGLGIYLRKNPSSRRLWVGILLNVLLLSVFKYLPLAAKLSNSSMLAGVGRLVLPIGISFWTFEALSYLFDLYREEDFSGGLRLSRSLRIGSDRRGSWSSMDCKSLSILKRHARELYFTSTRISRWEVSELR